MSIFIRYFSPIRKLNIKLGPFFGPLSISHYSPERKIYIHVILLHIILVSLQTLWSVAIGSKVGWVGPWFLEAAAIRPEYLLCSLPVVSLENPFCLEQAVFSHTDPTEKGSGQGRRITTMMMMRSPRPCGSDRAQTWALIPEGVAEITKINGKKRKGKRKKKEKAPKSYFGF